MSELEAKLGQARSDSKAQVKGHNTGKRELEASGIAGSKVWFSLADTHAVAVCSLCLYDLAFFGSVC